MSQNLREEILSRSDYHRGLLNFIENNPGCTSDDMFNSDVANAIIPIGIREMAIELWINEFIESGEVESRSLKLYSTGSTEWQGHNVITKENKMRITENQLRRIIRHKILKESEYTVGFELPQLVNHLKKIAYECGRRDIGIASKLPRKFHYGDMTGITPVLSYKDQDGSTQALVVDLPVFLSGTQTPWDSIAPFEREMFVADLLEEFPGSKKVSNSKIRLNTKGSSKYFNKKSWMGMIPGSLKF